NNLSYNTGNLRIDGCSFVGNYSKLYGGAISFTTSYGWTITNSSFCSNSVSSSVGELGGAIFMTSSDNNIITNCTFLDNSGPKNGGAIYATTAGAVITNSLFNGNTARNAVTSRGADIFVAGVPKSFSISNSYLQGPSSYNYTQ